MIHTRNFHVRTAEESLSSQIISNVPDSTPSILFVHGAGKATKDRYQYLAEYLANNSQSSLLFDFSGHGASTSSISLSSLRKRVEEASAMLSLLDRNGPRSLIASSMGAYIALKLTENVKIDNLVLFCPAVYTPSAFALPFDERFSQEIRRPDSWKDSDAFEYIRQFSGNLLIITGEEDKVIPAQLPAILFSQANKSAHKEILILPGAPHGLHYWLQDNLAARQRVFEAISQLIN